jgi:hypothetical protein
MNSKTVDDRGDEKVEPKTPIKISLHEFTEAEAKSALKSWTDTPVFFKSGIGLFGSGTAKSWTFAILSDLRPKVHEIRRGTLELVLRTALPLRDDFSIHLDGVKLEPSKAGKGRIKKWVLGKDIVEPAKPAPADIDASEDTHQPKDSDTRFALDHKVLGRITGYAEAYKRGCSGSSLNWKKLGED